MSEQEIREKYKYYRKEMLESINIKEFTEEGVAVINAMIKEKYAANDNVSSDIILDGGIKDELIRILRWHIIIFALGFAHIFIIPSSRFYGVYWVDTLVFYIISISCGLAASVVLYIFLTKKLKNKIIETWKYSSFVFAAFLIIGKWNLCRISYSC